MLYSMRLDETGTDGLSDVTIVGGAVATADQWDNLERKWAKLISMYELEDFQWKDWIGNRKPFSRWPPDKKRKFAKQQDEIIKKNTMFRCAVSVNKMAHDEVKERMRGIKGFSPDSDYSLGIRALMFRACEDIAQNLDPNCRLSVMVEDGPWSSGAYKVYQSVSKMTGKWKPAKHAHRLAGFDAVPKGERPSMSVADYICGTYLRLLNSERRLVPSKSGLLIVMDADRLYNWYDRMIVEKQSRRQFASFRQQRNAEQ
ncbi:MAG: hypothetical protein RID11_02160 [Roseovarius sp.]|uniref:hypothetical protein n=1 Tax=Roseovarius sp. TaxID=1486281 RepID=UPI0032EE73C6